MVLTCFIIKTDKPNATNCLLIILMPLGHGPRQGPAFHPCIPALSIASGSSEVQNNCLRNDSLR